MDRVIGLRYVTFCSWNGQFCWIEYSNSYSISIGLYFHDGRVIECTHSVPIAIIKGGFDVAHPY